jgi:hypothetical protein
MQPKAATKNFAVHYQVKKTGSQYKDRSMKPLSLQGLRRILLRIFLGGRFLSD